MSSLVHKLKKKSYAIRKSVLERRDDSQSFGCGEAVGSSLLATSTSKLAAPGLRIGWLAAPEAEEALGEFTVPASPNLPASSALLWVLISGALAAPPDLPTTIRKEPALRDQRALLIWWGLSAL